MSEDSPIIRYEYDAEADVLDIYFGENRRAWTIELTDNILLSIDKATQQPVTLTLLDLTALIRPAGAGPQSFPLTGLSDLPVQEKELVIRVLTTPPVSDFLDISSVVLPATLPLPVTHLEPLPLAELSRSRSGIFYPLPATTSAHGNVFAVLREKPKA
jgi:hypothetical protein